MKSESKQHIIYLVIIIVLLVIIVGSFFYFNRKLTSEREFMGNRVGINTPPPAGPNFRGRGPIIMSMGMNLKTSPIFKYAYQIAPGELSNASKKALVGWNINVQNQNDGSTTVTLTPKDSSDQNQQYTIKSGQTLYFIEQTPSDDKSDQDKDLNYRDDYGIIVDSSGIIQ